MKKLKTLIIESRDDVAGVIANRLLDVILLLNLEIGLIYAKNYEMAREKVMSGDYDIILLSDNLNGGPSLNLVGTILNLHPKAAIIFLSSSQKSIDEAKKLGIQLSFLEESDGQIIGHENQMEIKETLITKGFSMDYKILYQELTDALLIFSETKKEPELFVNNEPEFPQVTKILGDNKIKFSVVDRDMNTKIFVDGVNSQIVKELAELSCLEFWLDWSNVYRY